MTLREARPVVEHAPHTTLSFHELTQAQLEGASIYDPQDEEVGKVTHLHGAGALALVILDVGAVAGRAGRPVSLPMASLRFMRDAAGRVHGTTEIPVAQIAAMPDHLHG